MTSKTISFASAAVAFSAWSHGRPLSIASAGDLSASPGSVIYRSYADAQTIKMSLASSGVDSMVLTPGGTVTTLSRAIISRGSIGVSLAGKDGFITTGGTIGAITADSPCRAHPKIDRAAEDAA